MEGMTFVALYRDKKHKFKNGYWTWSESASKLKFHSHETEVVGGRKEMEARERRQQQTRAVSKVDKQQRRRPESDFESSDVGLRFVNRIDESEEQVFLQCFCQRPDSSDGSEYCDVITLRDIKSLSLFTLRSSVTKDFLELLHTPLYDAFLHAVIFYIDLFLMVLELLLIRRDEASEDAKIHYLHSLAVERDLSRRLSDRRLLLAREYSDILKHTCQMKKMSLEGDRTMFESLADFTFQCTFIAMHRRCHDAISCELNRLLRTELFNKAATGSRHEFTFREKQILFGQKCLENSTRHYRQQHSPLIAEALELSPRGAEIWKIGRQKYCGSDEYLFNLELHFTTPERYLRLIGQSRGILGHPKGLYNTLLQLDRSVLHRMNYSEHYDPYRLVRPVTLGTRISPASGRQKSLSTRLIIHREADGGAERRQLKLWKRRESIMRRNLSRSIVE